MGDLPGAGAAGTAHGGTSVVLGELGTWEWGAGSWEGFEQSEVVW